ncbi:hypothetical protein BI364_04025 [Acidihalobacter yilgarnensis]|uniref:Uncharacterized protein n=1 Tax=Acidihalobacter yilgarnensis TaxID=2819280 RepID=A0A1D8ILB6_9GAMM|nr:hypothetical protein [Acidihalobacter yilgarnensis]AOU97276.1 hypothetical protein BI364_04025 [Acidihalobacter yilgarnensis]
MLTLFGAVAVTLMMLFYALEARAPRFTLLFALSCFASSAYGWLAGTWPFGVIELIWGGIALYKWRQRVREGAAAG